MADFAVAHGEEALVFVASTLAFAWASGPAAHWLVDDAAISYAYGMNWGRHGQLAPNLEGTAVEGFSNPLTVGLVALLSVLRCFHPITTHHAIDAVVFGWVGLFAFRILRHALRTFWWVSWLGVALFLALELCTPATMIWYGSGLENGQLTLAILVLLWRLQAVLTRGFSPALDAPLLAAVALTRPEAPIFSLAWLGAAGLLVASNETLLAGRSQRPVKGLLGTAALTVLLLAIIGIIRYALFASCLPNTFYAKIGSVDIHRNYVDYVRPWVGTYWYAFGLSGSVVALFASGPLRRLAVAIVIFSCAALALPLVAGSDWMGHHRFATAFFMLGHLAFAAACSAAWSDRGRPGFVVAVARGVPAVGALFLFADGRGDYRSFVHDPYVSFALIADVEGFERVRLQKYLGMIYPVVALPDAGGSSVVGSMQLVDTASLVDYQMARVHLDSELVNRYEHDERRVDLAEYHAWSFDQGLVGSKFLGAVKFSAEQDYPNFWPSYAVRRDLVEVTNPGPASVHLGDRHGFEVYLSGRTVLVGAPGATLRVELLLSPREGSWDAGCRVQVAVAGSMDERKVFTLSPLSDTAIAPTPGRFYRHGFLVSLPSTRGEYPISVGLCADSSDGPFDARPTVLVRSPADLASTELRDRLTASPRGLIAEARWVAELREQLVPRLSTAEHARQQALFRASYRDQNRTNVGAYDALLLDSRPGFLQRMPDSVTSLEKEILATAGEISSRLWDDPLRTVGARTLAIARLVDELRRLGYLGVVGSERMAPAIAKVLSEREPRDDPRDSYARALGLALLVPGKGSYQKRLAEVRTKSRVEDFDEARWDETTTDSR